MKEAALNQVEYVPEQVFFSARDGMAISLCTLLDTVNQEQLKELLETVSIAKSFFCELIKLRFSISLFFYFQEVCDDNGQRCTPLIIAARNGHEKVVKVFLNKFPVNLEREGSVKKDNFLIEGATALWCAAGPFKIYVLHNPS